ncbi:hypothetical protein FOCC_FOCC011336 [Frankliniella occidentalis]|nr:hypothetical protein FOCC_FOCC011336 [Frankliniella occidentalis]
MRQPCYGCPPKFPPASRHSCPCCSHRLGQHPPPHHVAGPAVSAAGRQLHRAAHQGRRQGQRGGGGLEVHLDGAGPPVPHHLHAGLRRRHGGHHLPGALAVRHAHPHRRAAVQHPAAQALLPGAGGRAAPAHPAALLGVSRHPATGVSLRTITVEEFKLIIIVTIIWRGQSFCGAESFRVSEGDERARGAPA